MNRPIGLDSAVAEMIFLGSNAQIPLSELAEKTSASVQEIGESIQRLSMLGYPLNLRSDSVERLPIHTINRQELENSRTEGLSSSTPKSVIAPIPMNIRIGNISVNIPAS